MAERGATGVFVGALQRLRPPRLQSEEETLRARAFHRVVLSTTAIAVFFLTLLIVEMPASLQRRAISIGFLVVLCAGLLELNRRGRTRLASWFFVAGLVSLIAQRSFTSGGIGAASTMLFVIVVLIAGVLLDTWGGALTAAAFMAIGLAMVLVQSAGRLPPSELVFSAWSLWLYNCLALTFGIVLQHQITMTLRGLLDRAQTEIAARHRVEQHSARTKSDWRSSCRSARTS